MSEHEFASMEREPASVREVEAASMARENAIHAQIASLKDARIATRAACDLFDREYPYGVPGRDELWRERCWPMIEHENTLKTRLVDALQRHYATLNKAKNVPTNSGEYTAELIYPVRNGDFAMRTMRFTEYRGSLADVLETFRGYVSGDGLHNFGLDTDTTTSIGEVDYVVKNDKGFSFTGRVWINDGGHFVRDKISLR